MIDYNQRRANYVLVTKDMSPEAREFMASNPEYAFRYAKYILNDRFPEGEKAIATNGEYSYLYALVVLYKRFPEGEETIASSKYDRLYKALVRGN